MKRETAPRPDPTRHNRPLMRTVSVAAAVALAAGGAVASASGAGSASQPVTNLSHLTFLLDSVPLLTGVAGHTTYDESSQPTAQAPWVYANYEGNGTYQRVGGGNITNAAKGWYAQGAFDADDIARSAVVYLCDWKQNGTASSQQHAYELLRELTYLQDSSGPDAGNVVLWQQSDGTLNPTPTPPDSPNPSDSAESYWLARSVWALGEGYSDFEHADPSFAAFLQQRMDLALSALDRRSLAQFGQYVQVNGAKVPAWLLTGSAGATAEAVLGLSSYVAADPADTAARTALTDYADGIAAMASGGTGTWPFGAILPEDNSRSYWHAWSGLAPAALSDAATTLHRSDLERVADTALAQFTAQLLASGGPDNALEPTPGDTSQIAYGADSLVESLLTAADDTHDAGLDTLAAIAAGWYFGANPANQPAYDPSTGDCIDGISSTGAINQNCGAESAIHTELSMLELDAHPAVKALAEQLTSTTAVDGMQTIAAASGTVTGPASVETPASQWTGSASFFDDTYVDAKAGSTVTIAIPAGLGAVNVYPVINRQQGDEGSTSWSVNVPNSAKPLALGKTANGGVGAQGIAPTPTELIPMSLGRAAPAGATTLTAQVTSGDAQINAVIIQPVVSTLTMAGPSGPYTLYVNGSTQPQTATNTSATASAIVTEYSDTGSLIWSGRIQHGVVPVAPAGFTTVTAAG
ncbi:MAG TPA: hypothetical protein VGM10_05150 [Actinocrinis sp.]